MLWLIAALFSAWLNAYITQSVACSPCFRLSLFCAINFSDLVLSLRFSILYGVRFIQGFLFNQFID